MKIDDSDSESCPPAIAGEIRHPGAHRRHLCRHLHGPDRRLGRRGSLFLSRREHFRVGHRDGRHSHGARALQHHVDPPRAARRGRSPARRSVARLGRSRPPGRRVRPAPGGDGKQGRRRGRPDPGGDRPDPGGDRPAHRRDRRARHADQAAGRDGRGARDQAHRAFQASGRTGERDHRPRPRRKDWGAGRRTRWHRSAPPSRPTGWTSICSRS